jgi:hypothetical protein
VVESASAADAAGAAAQVSLGELSRSLDTAQRTAEQAADALARAREVGHKEAAKYVRAVPVRAERAQSSTMPAEKDGSAAVAGAKEPEPQRAPVRAMPKEATDGGLRFQYGASAMISAP